MRLTLLSTAALLGVALSTPARASLFDTYGYGARAAAMGNAAAAASEDYTATHYNPGALTYRKSPHVGVGFHLISPDLYIERSKPKAYGGGEVLPQPNAGLNLGLLFPLGGLVQDRFALGIGAYVPAVHVTRVESMDVRAPYFYRYQSLPDKLIVAAAVAYELHPRFSLGVGYQYLNSLDGSAEMDLDPLNLRFTRKDMNVEIGTASALSVGLDARPTDQLRVALTFRDALALDYRIFNRIYIDGVGLIETEMEGTSTYTPQQYTLGLSWRPTPAWLLAFDAVWARWSQAPKPTAAFYMLLSFDELGLEPVENRSDVYDLGAEDTLSPHIGVEHQRGALALRAGYAFLPTPLPAQTSYTNFLDADTHQIGLGVGYSFPDPLAMHEAPITIDLAAQLSQVEAREANKDDPE
ncbi:outer membrane protein transport protein, partial [Myxococcota bacterium]|nr:outer membrane protein transport protein [Myxococcota bacterium]